MADTKISVIVPVFNTEQYLAECLDSILGQSLGDIEVLCVDDGSTDHSLQILQEYARQDSRLIIVDTGKENQGPGFVRNFALTQATGEYIAFVDSDDYIHPNMLLEMYQRAKMDKVDMVLCTIKKFNDNPKEEHSPCSYDKNIATALDATTFSWIDIKNVLFGLRFVCVNKIYRKDFLLKNNIKFSEGIFYEDMVFTYMALLSAKKMCLVRKNFYFNRRQREGATTFIQGGRVFGALQAMHQLEQFVMGNPEFKDIQEPFTAFKLKKLMSYLHKNDADHIEKYYEALKDCVRDPALTENPYLTDNSRLMVKKIRDSELLEFLMYMFWETNTKNASLKRKNVTLKKRNKALDKKVKKLLKFKNKAKFRIIMGKTKRALIAAFKTMVFQFAFMVTRNPAWGLRHAELLKKRRHGSP